MKSLLLTGFLFLILFTDLKAQDKYDYAMVTYRGNYKFIEVCINGESYEKIEVNDPVISSFIDTEGLKQVKKMNNEGWELIDTEVVFQTMSGFYLYIYYLRKKVD